MKRILIILISFITVSSLTASEYTIFNSNEFLEISKKSSSIQSDEIGIEFELLKSNANEIFKTGPKTLEIHDFPMASGLRVDIRLKKERSIVAKDAVIKTTDKDGEKRREMPEINSFSGAIIGQPGSQVFLNYSDLGIIGFILDVEGKTFNISPGILENSNNIKHSVVQTSIEDVLSEMNADFCGVSDYSDEEIDHDHDNHNLNNKNNKVQAKERLLEVKMAADGNFEFFLMFCQRVTGGGFNNWLYGNNNEEGWFFQMTESEKEEAENLALTYLNNVMSATSKVYEVQANVTYKLVYVNIYKHPDLCPYYLNGTFEEDLRAKLQKMPDIWNSKNDVPKRTLATLFTDNRRQPSNSIILGIANSGQGYSGTLFSSGSGFSALGINGNASFPRLAFATDVQVAAHEFGHNFGCPHTHNCELSGYIGYTGSGTIDTCVTNQINEQFDEGGCLQGVKPRGKIGTIMSYCHYTGSIEYKFHPAMRAHIRKRAEAAEGKNNSFEPEEPIVVLKRPLGTEDFFVGKSEEIQFNAAHVPSSSLFYSTNNGSDWILIDDNVNTAENEVYEWQVPDELSNNALVKIEANSDPDIFDQSVLTFKITKRNVTSVFPEEGGEIGYLGDNKLVWQKTNVDTVNVKYSLDDGESWNTIVKNTTSNSIDFNFPDQSKENALLLIEDAEDPENTFRIISFDLGKENVIFNDPIPGRKYCKQFLDDDTFVVKFEREYVEDFNLEISIDGGENWKSITNFVNKIDPETNTFDWDYVDDIEDKDSAFILMRAILKSDNDIVIGEVTDEEFIIKQCITLVSDYNFSNRFKINNISPNPTSNDVNINIFNGFESSKRFKVKIINTNGKVFYETDYKIAFSGNSVLNLETQRLNPGTYYILLESDEYQDVQQLQIIR